MSTSTSKKHYNNSDDSHKSINESDDASDFEHELSQSSRKRLKKAVTPEHTAKQHPMTRSRSLSEASPKAFDASHQNLSSDHIDMGRRIDASVYNHRQLQWVKESYPSLFSRFDFSLCHDETIYSLFSPGHYQISDDSLPPVIPPQAKTSPLQVQYFMRLGLNQMRAMATGDRIQIPSSRTSTSQLTYQCLGISKQELLDGMQNPESLETYSAGYDDAVERAVRDQVQIYDQSRTSLGVFERIGNSDGCIMRQSSSNNFVLNHYGTLLTHRDQHYFNSLDGCAKVSANARICTKCCEMKDHLINYIRRTNKLLSNPLDIKTANGFILSHPHLIEQKLSMQKKEIRKLRRQNKAISEKLAKAKLSKSGVDIVQSGKKINKALDDLMCDEEITKMASEWFKEKELSEDGLATAIFTECLRNARTSRATGKRSVRYSPLIIRYAIYLRSKLKKPGYDFLAKTFNFPTSRTLANYDSLDSCTANGIMVQTLVTLGLAFRLLSSNDEWFRMGTLAFDSMYVKQKIVFDMHTMEIVGFEHDAFDEDVILREFQALEEESSAAAAGVQKEDKTPALATQYLAFFFQTWEGSAPVQKHMVARYSVGNSITSDFLVKCIRHIIKALYTIAGAIVTNITADGASENRAAFKLLATKTPADLDIFDNLPASLPKNVPICFEHPIRNDIMVFIGGEMPHWVKKFVNALEWSSKPKEKRNLQFQGKPLSLKMIQKVWEYDRHSANDCRTNWLTSEHFEKNAFSRMRVHLAVQVVSNSVVQLISTYEEREDADYSSLKLIVENVDRLVDLWNGCRDKGFNNIDSPEHEYIDELYKILQVFAEWRNEIQELIKEKKRKKEDTKELTFRFIPNQLWTDLVWLVYGIVGVAKTYLRVDRSRMMVQRRGGTDVAEHDFGSSRGLNATPTAHGLREIGGRKSGFRTSNYEKCAKTNSTGERMSQVNEINAPLTTVKRDEANKKRREAYTRNKK